MPLYNPPNQTTGIDTIFIDIMSEVPSFVPSFLFFIFMVVLLSGTISQRRRSGSADTPMWMTIAGISTLMVALPLTLTLGLIDVVTLSIVVVVTVVSGFWFFMSRSRSEAF